MLSPKLFMSYINDICNVWLKCVLLADGTNLEKEKNEMAHK